MNAPNSTPGERDLDALRRAQRAHEPSMEEILASIRSIIADDREPAAARPAPKPDAAPSGPQIVYSKEAAAPARAVEPLPPAEPATPKVVWSQPLPQAIPAASAPKPEPEPAPPEDEAPSPPLLSDQADEAVSAAFEALSTSLALQSSELAENAAREILRPLLKTWLDENLPSMVERLVKAEIQRVARGGR